MILTLCFAFLVMCALQVYIFRAQKHQLDAIRVDINNLRKLVPHEQVNDLVQGKTVRYIRIAPDHWCLEIKKGPDSWTQIGEAVDPLICRELAKRHITLVG